MNLQMPETNKYTVNGRIWIDTPNGKVIGHGRIELMERIQESGSIRQAALQMKMSYRQAWELVKYINENIGEPVIVSQRGGKGGGNAFITEKGLEIIKFYKIIQQNLFDFLKSQEELLKF